MAAQQQQQQQLHSPDSNVSEMIQPAMAVSDETITLDR